MREKVRGEAGAVVGDVQFDRGLLLYRGEFDAASRVADGVCEEVIEGLPDAVRVGATTSWLLVSDSGSVATSTQMAALSWMEQSVEVGGELPLLVQLGSDARAGVDASSRGRAAVSAFAGDPRGEQAGGAVLRRTIAGSLVASGDAAALLVGVVATRADLG